jgi:hypothetical protein
MLDFFLESAKVVGQRNSYSQSEKGQNGQSRQGVCARRIPDQCTEKVQNGQNLDNGKNQIFHSEQRRGIEPLFPLSLLCRNDQFRVISVSMHPDPYLLLGEGRISNCTNGP